MFSPVHMVPSRLRDGATEIKEDERWICKCPYKMQEATVSFFPMKTQQVAGSPH